MAETKRESFLGLSWLQLIAGSLAAMTSAWIASAFGVSGTIIGAAVGSLSASIATALYFQSLSRGQELVRRPITQSRAGSVVTQTDDPESTVVIHDGEEAESITDLQDADPVTAQTSGMDSTRNRQIVIGTVVALAIALLSIGAFEFISGNPFGQAERPAIGRPWQPAPTATTPSPTEETPDPTESPTTPTEPTPEPTQDVTPVPTEPIPTSPVTPDGPGETEPTPAP